MFNLAYSAAIYLIPPALINIAQFIAAAWRNWQISLELIW